MNFGRCIQALVVPKPEPGVCLRKPRHAVLLGGDSWGHRQPRGQCNLAIPPHSLLSTGSMGKGCRKGAL